MTDFEKLIYNHFLEVSKKVNNKPVRYRKDFSNFSDEDYIYVNKLSRFFNKFKNINIKDFFEAPYFVYNENYFSLKFYLSPKAIKAYTNYSDNYILNNPDSKQTLQKLLSLYHPQRDGLFFEFDPAARAENELDLTERFYYVHISVLQKE